MRAWYVGEPSAEEYGRAIAMANRNASDEYFKVVHNNVGFLGYYITTPFNKYILVESRVWGEHDYTLHEYTNRAFSYGMAITDKKFHNLEEAKEYIREAE